jgi:hypothetical protein
MPHLSAFAKAFDPTEEKRQRRLVGEPEAATFANALKEPGTRAAQHGAGDVRRD